MHVRTAPSTLPHHRTLSYTPLIDTDCPAILVTRSQACVSGWHGLDFTTRQGWGEGRDCTAARGGVALCGHPWAYLEEHLTNVTVSATRSALDNGPLAVVLVARVGTRVQQHPDNLHKPACMCPVNTTSVLPVAAVVPERPVVVW